MRWVLLIVSLICFVLGWSVKYRNPTLPSEPEVLTIPEAVAKLDTWKNYVSLSASINTGVRVYSTDVKSPVYALESTNQVHSVVTTDKELKRYLGTTVRVNGRTESGGVQMQMIENVVGDDKVMSQRQLSPLEGSKGNVWVLTNRRVGSDGTSDLDGVGVFEGVLTRFVDFDKNLTSFIRDYSLISIQKQLSKAGKFEITDETFLIVLGLENTMDNLFYCPVDGSDHVLYAAMTEKLAAEPPNPIVGIMETWDNREEGDLGTLLIDNPAEKIGILRHGWTVEAYNNRTANSVRGTFLFGFILLFIAVIIFIRRRLKKNE